MSFLNILGFAMSIVYVGAGIFVLISKNIFNFTNFQKIGFGIILISYGLFRFYNALKQKREGEKEEDEE